MKALLGRLLLLIVAFFAVYDTVQEVRFQRTATPKTIDSIADSRYLTKNQYVTVDIPLDYEKAVGVQYLSKREFVIIPFADSNNRLFYALEGPIDKGSILQFLPPFTGRLAGKNFADKWEIYDKSIKLQDIFKRQHRISITDDTLVLYQSERKGVGLWQYTLAGLGLLYMLFFVKGLLGLRKKDGASKTIEGGHNQAL